MVKKETLVILGGGPAGIAAARAADTNTTAVVLISNTPVGGVQVGTVCCPAGCYEQLQI